MTTANAYKALYQTLKAGPLASIPLQQPHLTKPSATTWAVLSDEGSSVSSDRDPYRSRQYFRVWIYSQTDDETTLYAIADSVKAAINDKPISGTNTGYVRFTFVSRSPVWWAEEYGCRAVDLQFKTLTTEI